MAAGLSVLVLEARDRVGRRPLNHTLEDGAVVELGGQWVGPTQDRVLAFAGGLSGSVFSLDDVVSVIFDNSPQDLSCGLLLGFLEGGTRAGPASFRLTSAGI